MKIAIVNSSSFGRYFEEHIEALKKIGTVESFSFKSNESDDVLIDNLSDFDYIISSVTPIYRRKFFEQCPKLKLISRHGIGYNNIDLEAANDHKVFVTKVDANIEKDAVAENAVALLMALSRGIVPAQKAILENKWHLRSNFMGYQLQGKVLGLIGFGNIGSRVATILKNGFNMKVYAYDPNISVNIKNKINDIEFTTLEEVVSRADFISLNAYLDDSSYHMIDKEVIKLMKSNVLIVNTARGGLIDDVAIVDAIKNGKISGYAADVVENEPIDNKHHLLTHGNVLITPHISAYTWECLKGMGNKCVNDVMKVNEGEKPSGCVTKF